MKLLRLAALGAGIAAVVLFVGVGRPDRAISDNTAPAARSITVSGNGTVSATPNQAQFTFGVGTRGKTAVQALADNAAEMTKLIGALKAAGIAAADLQTSSVSLSAITSDQGDAIIGYSASNSVTATIANVARAGAIVDTAVAAGANQVDGPNLTVSDQAALYRAALKNAVADARVKAEALAAASGLQVGAVSSVEEATNTPSPINFDAVRATPSPSTPIVVGSQEIAATVTVVFDVS